MIKAKLLVRVAHETYSAFYSREAELPVLFPGLVLVLVNLLEKPEGCDPSELKVAEVAYDMEKRTLTACLELDDYREKASGGKWTPGEIDYRYAKWQRLSDEEG